MVRSLVMNLTHLRIFLPPRICLFVSRIIWSGAAAPVLILYHASHIPMQKPSRPCDNPYRGMRVNIVETWRAGRSTQHRKRRL